MKPSLARARDTSRLAPRDGIEPPSLINGRMSAPSEKRNNSALFGKMEEFVGRRQLS